MNLLKQMAALLVVALALGTAGCGKSPSDATITSRVKTAISKEPELKATKVSVSTDAKVVHLSGTVNSRAERAMLIAVARKVEGVKGVKTDLAVKPEQTAAVETRGKKAAPETPGKKAKVETRKKRELQAKQNVKPRAIDIPGQERGYER